VNDGRAKLRLDVVADDWDARSQEAPRPFGLAGNEYGILLTKATPASSAHSA
jgi:hypothetical protein